MDSSVLRPVRIFNGFGFTNGKRAVKLLRAASRISMPGDMLPPRYSFRELMKSYVTQVPMLMTRTFFPEKYFSAPATRAMRSLPSVEGVLYLLVNGSGVLLLRLMTRGIFRNVSAF